MKRQPLGWEKIKANEVTDKELTSKICNGGKIISLTSGPGKLVNHLEKYETRTLANTIHKNKLKMD